MLSALFLGLLVGALAAILMAKITAHVGLILIVAVAAGMIVGGWIYKSITPTRAQRAWEKQADRNRRR